MQNEASIKVWDIGVRVFHWGLVALFVLAYITGEGEEESAVFSLHAWAGYIIIGLLAFRIIWGFVGSRHARFSDFIYAPGEVFAYLKGLLISKPKHYLGHNPAGGLMVIAMLLTLIVVSWTGLMAYGSEGKGPLAQADISLVATAQADGWEYDEHEGAEGDEFWEELHEGSVNFMLLLIVLHLTGVAVSSIQHRENLPRAMLTGWKKRPIE